MHALKKKCCESAQGATWPAGCREFEGRRSVPPSSGSPWFHQEQEFAGAPVSPANAAPTVAGDPEAQAVALLQRADRATRDARHVDGTALGPFDGAAERVRLTLRLVAPPIPGGMAGGGPAPCR